jgi:2-C-methyl-D-erythritol 4-phosphate cytidylyltransferase
VKRNHVIVAAGGKGERFGSAASKQLHTLVGKPIVAWSLDVFQKEDSITRIVLVYPQGSKEEQYRKIAQSFGKTILIAGGASRYDSVRNGFEALQAQPTDTVLIHDAARPLLSSSLLARVLTAATENSCVIPALPVLETIKEVQNDRIVRTVARRHLYMAQTPQAFRYSVLKQAYARISSEEEITDEALMVEKAGFEISVVQGERTNIKITEPYDVQLAEFYLKEVQP